MTSGNGSELTSQSENDVDGHMLHTNGVCFGDSKNLNVFLK